MTIKDLHTYKNAYSESKTFANSHLLLPLDLYMSCP